jgi:hypothetical protein
MAQCAFANLQFPSQSPENFPREFFSPPPKKKFGRKVKSRVTRSGEFSPIGQIFADWAIVHFGQCLFAKIVGLHTLCHAKCSVRVMR